MKLKLLVSAIMAAGIVSAPLALAADDVGGNPKIPPAAALSDCCTPGDADFPKVGGNLGNQNYSRLKAINKDNIGQLGAVWLNRIEGGINTGTNQSTTVVVDGVIYIESAFGHVYAVDGKTGLTKWKYTQTRGTLTRRGVAVAKDLGLVYTLSNGNWVVALNKDTGAVVWERQHNGWGNLEKVAIVYYDKMLYIGSNDATRNAAVALDATNGDMKWHFWGWPAAGEPFYDTWGGGPQSGASSWIHPAIDPELGLVYWAFGNTRGNSSQNGSNRPGQNLFANSLVALDMKTGERKWHFQSIHHDIWDMDNVMAPVLVDLELHGRGDKGDRGSNRDEDKMRKLVVYGSKGGMYYILDRTDGSAPLGIDEVPVAVDPRQASYPTQPIPRQGGWYCHGEKCAEAPAGVVSQIPSCIVNEPLGGPIPGDPNRAVPNYAQGCLYSAHWDVPILTAPGHGGGADWNHQSFSQSTKLVYTGFGNVPAAHSLTEASNGLRPPGEYQTGGIVAVDPSTNLVKWKKHMPYELAHGNGILTTRSDLLFIGQPDGNVLALDAKNGDELWRFQTGAAISASPVTYEIDGEQYVAIYAGGTGIPYGDSAPRGDFLWAFKVGGTLPPAATPTPPVIRRPVSGGPVEGSATTPPNTVILARTRSATGVIGATESTAVNGMAPTHLRVPVGTTVTFLNDPRNVNVHCATQFFEGLFNPQLKPGESFQYTFTQKGEFFFNDCFSPRPTGKIEVY
jgi:alcohol dehydrogenase (cytochrome c)